MFLREFGEVLTDAMTVSPSLSAIPSASAILDTSNYTFNVVTLGKDAHGFNHHAHVVSSTSEDPEPIYNSGVLAVQGYNNIHVSSYHFSSTYTVFKDSYSSVPQAPTPYDTRLETNDTSTNAPNVPDYGRYINAAIDTDLSSAWNVIGAFAPSGNTDTYHFRDLSGGFFSGTLSSVYNEFGLVDKRGHIKINPERTLLLGAAYDGTANGCQIFSSIVSPLSSGNFKLSIVPKLGDAASLAMFGGVNQVGVHCLDMKSMLASGLTPPYNWDHLNNNRQYKLVAKVTTWDNLLYHTDLDLRAVNPGLGFAGFNSGIHHLLNTNAEAIYGPGGADFFTLDGPVISLLFRFA